MIENDGEKNRFLSGRQMFYILSILLILASGIWGYNTLRLKEINVDGLTRYTKEQLVSKLDPGFWMTITPLFCLQDSVRQVKIPFIEKYEIDYIDRHSARITVYEKRITGCVVVMGRYLFFDKDGIVVETSNSKVNGIPVVTGLKFDEIVLYQKLNIQKQSLFHTILELTRLIEKNQLPVQEIEFNSVYEVTLYLENTTVMLGKQTSYDEQMNALPNILMSVKGRNGTLDMRNYTKENQEVILKER